MRALPWEQWGLPVGSVRAGPGSQGLSQHPSQEQGSWGTPGQPQPWASPWGQGWAKAGMGWDIYTTKTLLQCVYLG